MSIRKFEWGRIEMEDGKVFKDAIVYFGGSQEWDWSNDGTRHNPGITVQALEPLLKSGCTHFILSKGVDCRLQATPEVIRFLKESSRSWFHLQSEEAVNRYASLLREGVKVGMLLHSTC